MTHEVVAWLTQELREHFYDFGKIGLYELVWSLNGSPFDLSAEEKLRVARRVASRLVADGIAMLYEVTWPSSDTQVGPLPGSVLDEDASWLEGDTYVALVPCEPASPP